MTSLTITLRTTINPLHPPFIFIQHLHSTPSLLVTAGRPPFTPFIPFIGQVRTDQIHPEAEDEDPKDVYSADYSYKPTKVSSQNIQNLEQQLMSRMNTLEANNATRFARLEESLLKIQQSISSLSVSRALTPIDDLDKTAASLFPSST